MANRTQTNGVGFTETCVLDSAECPILISPSFGEIRMGSLTLHILCNHAKSCLILLYNIYMRNTKTLSVTLPPDMLKRAQSIARKESRTMSELIREALRYYERRCWWDEVNAYGQSKAARQGIREPDIDRLVQELRATKRATKK